MQRFLCALSVYFFASVVSAAELEVIHGWLQLPEGEILGQVSGVSAGVHGDVWVFHRASRVWSPNPAKAGPIPDATVWRIDGATGRVLARWGAGTFLLPHGLFVDSRRP